jgi:tetratricopeptide (TPR) repeat protein
MAAKDWQAAADIYAAGLATASASSLLQNNVGYLAQEWQSAVYAAGGAQEIAAISARLAKQFPGIPGVAESGRNQIQRAISEQLKGKNFEKALTIVKSASSLLPASDLTAFNEHIYDGWAYEKMAAKDWQAAADLYAAGLAAAGPTTHLQNNVAYFAQEWAQAALAKGGTDAILPVARHIGEKFSDVPDARETLIGVVGREVNRKASAGDYEGAVALSEKSQAFLPADEAARLLEFSYDNWARTFFGGKQWKEAVKIYDRALERLPESSMLKQNRAYCLAQEG